MWVLGVGLSWGDLRWRSVALLPFFWNRFTRGSVSPSLPLQQKKRTTRLLVYVKLWEKLRFTKDWTSFPWIHLAFFPYSSPIHKIYWQGWVTIFWMWSDPPLQSDPSWIHLSQDQMGQVSMGIIIIKKKTGVTSLNDLLDFGHTVLSRGSELLYIMCG